MEGARKGRKGNLPFNPQDRTFFVGVNQKNAAIHSVISLILIRHSCESRNPGKHWIPGQARNDKKEKTYVVLYR